VRTGRAAPADSPRGAPAGRHFDCTGWAAGRGPIPVVGEDGKPIGIITGAGLFAALNDLLAGPITARREQRLAEPCLIATDRDVPMFRTDERIRHVRPTGRWHAGCARCGLA
jgi:hypothetical protein